MFKRLALTIAISVVCVGLANAAPKDYVENGVVTVIDLGATTAVLMLAR